MWPIVTFIWAPCQDDCHTDFLAGLGLEAFIRENHFESVRDAVVARSNALGGQLDNQPYESATLVTMRDFGGETTLRR
jgi:hypothetical protein